MKRSTRTFTVALAAALSICAAVAVAQARWVVKGHGFGHGIGLSQYGAYGYAKHGRSYKTILAHYYRHTKLEQEPSKSVRVLLDAAVSSIPFHGATRACGEELNAATDYEFDLSGSHVKLRNGHGSAIRSCGAQGSASGGATVFYGEKAYRGKLVGREVGGTLYAINRVGVDDYVRGVVPNEMPASWPANALRAQAVAARGYALASTVNGNGYDLFDDSRSQVYGGRSTEQATTDEAVADTAGKVLTYHGVPAVTYFSSSSGGQTENIEFSFIGSAPVPYLVGVDDPYDDASPDHTWRQSFTDGQMAAKLSGLFQGKLRAIRVLKTGVSPRIVKAKVVGSKESTTSSGPALEARLGLRSAWASFKRK